MTDTRYFLNAWVGINGSVEYCDNLGWMRVNQIVDHRRWDDQYAIVTTPGHAVEVWNLLDDAWIARSFFGAPVIVGTYEQVEQAVMATALTIGSGDV